jgi:hypothetical protein
LANSDFHKSILPTRAKSTTLWRSTHDNFGSRVPVCSVPGCTV